MKKKLTTLLTILALVWACTNQRNEDANYIKKLEEQTFSSKAVRPDMKLAGELVLAYVDFAGKYPQDSLAVSCLFRAGEVSMNLGQGAKAIEYFDKFIQKYPDNIKTAHCIFLQAFVYETILKDLLKAKDKYNEFLNKYPTHELAKDARASIDLLGKTPEEVIRGFEEKNKQAEKK